MQNNYYFLRQLSPALETILTGTVISECYSQTRDELILRFETHAGSFFVRVTTSSSFSALSFPPSVERARRNSVDLFPDVVGHRVSGIRQFVNERSVAIVLGDDRTILLKLHGNRGNVVVFVEGMAPQLFRSSYPGDSAIDLNRLDRPIDWTLDAYREHAANPGKLYFTFGPVVWRFLAENGFGSATQEEQWRQILRVAKTLENPAGYWLAEIDGRLHFSLLPFAGARPAGSDPVAAANSFYQAFTHDFVLQQEKSAWRARLRARLNASTSYYEKNLRKLEEIERDSSYKTWADLIMAFLHEIKPGMETVTLPDFYQPGRKVEIRLKKELSPQANAALYYRKAKNQHIETGRIRQALAGKDTNIEQLTRDLKAIDEVRDLKKLRELVRQRGYQRDPQDLPDNLPYHEFVVDGFRIWVGKNAEDNDTLTLKLGYKEDLWLHAKDVAGSHVLIKHQAGKKFPRNVIERAAELAAYNSRRKTETLCPVIVTPRKFVRKRKGDPPGAVVVEREDVIMVEPRL